MPLTRSERLSLHKKQERLQVKSGKPVMQELKEGVPVLRLTSEGLTEYVKYKEIMYKKVWELE
jgi:hypothetical protein